MLPFWGFHSGKVPERACGGEMEGVEPVMRLALKQSKGKRERLWSFKNSRFIEGDFKIERPALGARVKAELTTPGNQWDVNEETWGGRFAATALCSICWNRARPEVQTHASSSARALCRRRLHAAPQTMSRFTPTEHSPQSVTPGPDRRQSQWVEDLL